MRLFVGEFRSALAKVVDPCQELKNGAHLLGATPAERAISATTRVGTQESINSVTTVRVSNRCRGSGHVLSSSSGAFAQTDYAASDNNSPLRPRTETTLGPIRTSNPDDHQSLPPTSWLVWVEDVDDVGGGGRGYWRLGGGRLEAEEAGGSRES